MATAMKVIEKMNEKMKSPVATTYVTRRSKGVCFFQKKGTKERTFGARFPPFLPLEIYWKIVVTYFLAENCKSWKSCL